jgi:hypothetical protein
MSNGSNHTPAVKKMEAKKPAAKKVAAKKK